MIYVRIITFVFIFKVLLVECQLYSSNDNITVFEPESFKQTFAERQSVPWLIQFYSSYCGHCIHFSPIFKEFLLDAKYWKKVIKIGVVDCSVHKTLCQEQEIEFFPYFKLLRSKSSHQLPAIGQHVALKTNTLDDFFESVINVIEWKLKPERLIELRNNMSIEQNNYFILSGGDEIILKRIILTLTDRLPYPIYYQRRYKKPDFTLVVAIGSSKQLFRARNQKELYQFLSMYVDRETQKPANATIHVANFAADRAYNQDIYSSIIFSFFNEIDDKSLNNVENVVILRHFVEKLFLYSDINKEITDSFRTLHELLKSKIIYLESGSKSDMLWSEMLEYAMVPIIKPNWIGCEGSLPYLRRYPCGLWTLFHTLTVNHHLKLKSNEIEKDDSVNLMKSIREFIITFFMCQECARNFKEGTKDYEIQVTDSKSAILYLWKVHNKVNHRLSNELTDDPAHPKISFPSKISCPACRLVDGKWLTHDQWNEDKVLEYLVNRYSNRVPFNLGTQA